MPGSEKDRPVTDRVSETVVLRDEAVTRMVARAIAEDRVTLAFQPIVQADDQEATAFYEALLRIVDDTGEVVPAQAFLPAVETTEHGRRLDCIALEQGLAELRREPWLRLAVNMSARSIGSMRWMEILTREIDADPTLAERLILEITESSAILVPEIVAEFIEDLRLRGVSFAVDDFGAGYTSLRHFKSFAFDILKIDGAFVRGVAQDRDSQVMISAMLDIARHFDLFTVAERVETPEDAEMLTQLGLHCLQGYYFAAPTMHPYWRQSHLEEQTA